MTEIVQREYLEQQQFQGINGKVGNIKRKAGQNKTIPAVQVSYPQHKICNNQRKSVSSVRGKKTRLILLGERKEKNKTFIFLF